MRTITLAFAVALLAGCSTSSTNGTMERRTGRACLRTDGTLAIDFDPARRL